MLKYQVRTPGDVAAYLLDCTMATVADMAMRKSRPKGEYQRQIAIAQAAYDWLRMMKVEMRSTRAIDLPIHDNSVAKWAAQFEPETAKP